MDLKELRDCKALVKDITIEFGKAFFTTFKAQLLHELANNSSRDKIAKSQAKLAKKVPRRRNRSASASVELSPTTTDPKFTATIADWKEVKQISHYGVRVRLPFNRRGRFTICNIFHAFIILLSFNILEMRTLVKRIVAPTVLLLFVFLCFTSTQSPP